MSSLSCWFQQPFTSSSHQSSRKDGNNGRLVPFFGRFSLLESPAEKAWVEDDVQKQWVKTPSESGRTKTYTLKQQKILHVIDGIFRSKIFTNILINLLSGFKISKFGISFSGPRLGARFGLGRFSTSFFQRFVGLGTGPEFWPRKKISIVICSWFISKGIFILFFVGPSSFLCLTHASSLSFTPRKMAHHQLYQHWN